jgi:hypothetical protein
MRQVSVVRSVVAAVLLVAGTGCAHTLTANVRPYDGNYQLTYHPWENLLDEFGRGADRVRDEVRRAPKEQIATIWKRAYSEAALNYLRSRSLIPPECGGKVVMGISRQFEGGGGSTDFKCG